MVPNLVLLLKKFRDIDNVETQLSYFKTKVPSIAPLAYLNVIYKPAPCAVIDSTASQLRLPSTLVAFYRKYNGARLFNDCFAIYGCLPERYLLNRGDPFALLPFGIREVNREFSTELKSSSLLCVGSYGYDRSVVCLDRESGEVRCFVEETFSRVRQKWPSLSRWITSEVQRLAGLFDQDGNFLGFEKDTLPGRTSRPRSSI